MQTPITRFQSSPIEIDPRAWHAKLGILVLSFGSLAALAIPVALAQQNVDTVVTNGKSTMPAWRGRLTPAEIRKVVVYERTKLGQ